MFGKILLTAAIACAFAGVVRADDQEDIGAALQKLAASPSYTWKSTVEGGFAAGETTGKTRQDGLTTLTIKRQDASYDVVMQGAKAVVKTEEGWKTAAELAAAPQDGNGPSPTRFLGMMIQNFKTPVAMMQAAAGKLENVKKTDDAYTADLSEEAAKQAMMFRRRGQNADAGPTITNAKVSIKMWIKDGIVTKIQNHATGTMSFNGNDRDIDRTTSTEFTDVGSTEITVPADAQAKLSAAPATQP